MLLSLLQSLMVLGLAALVVAVIENVAVDVWWFVPLLLVVLLLVLLLFVLLLLMRLLLLLLSSLSLLMPWFQWHLALVFMSVRQACGSMQHAAALAVVAAVAAAIISVLLLLLLLLSLL